MTRPIHLLIISVLLLCCTSCIPKKKADAIYYDGTVYTVNGDFSVVEAFAVKDGKIVGVGSNDNVMEDFDSDHKIDLRGRAVFPGFIDAHCHFFGYASDMVKCDLTGTASWADVLKRLSNFSKSNSFSWLLGRGWDQNDWEDHSFPDRTQLDSLFPDQPVFLVRIDGHAALCNKKALDLAGLNTSSVVTGGEILKKNGVLTGLLIDNAVDLVSSRIPAIPDSVNEKSLMKAQANCFAVGLTTVDDAGLGKDTIAFLKKLQDAHKLKMRIYAMLADNPATLNAYLPGGPQKTPLLNIRAIKMYADGSLGSRGACLKQEYTDQKGHYGFLLHPKSYFDSVATLAANSGFQLCTHCIGDSAAKTILEIYADKLSGENNRRWRIEHAQVVDPKDRKMFERHSVIPSVQPTHATSDMYWAEERLGKSRMKGAYAYRNLLEDGCGVIAFGTDFPVERINPIYTFYAATARKDLNGQPEGGFQSSNSVKRKIALKAMTIWAAFANCEDEEKGSIEEGKYADFVILDRDIMEVDDESIPAAKVMATYLNGERVFGDQ